MLCFTSFTLLFLFGFYAKLSLCLLVGLHDFIPFCSSQFYFESYLMWLYKFLMVKSFRKEGSLTEIKSSLSTVDKKHTQNLRQTHQKTTHYAIFFNLLPLIGSSF